MKKASWFILSLIVTFSVIGVSFISPVTKKAYEKRIGISRDKNKYFHSSDYSKITGKLLYQEKNDLWKLEYGDKSDPYNGYMILKKDKALNSFKNEQLVTVTGEIAKDQTNYSTLGVLYTFITIEKAM